MVLATAGGDAAEARVNTASEALGPSRAGPAGLGLGQLILACLQVIAGRLAIAACQIAAIPGAGVVGLECLPQDPVCRHRQLSPIGHLNVPHVVALARQPPQR